MDSITLRRFRAEDAEAIASFCNDEMLQRYLLLSILPYTIENAKEFIDYAARNEREGGEQCFAVLLNGKVIGSISYTLQSGCHSNSATIGYYIARECWGRGYMVEAVKQIVKIVFGLGGINRIYAQIFAQNDASARVLEKCGFVCEGFLRKAIVKNGKEYDAKLYALIKD